MTIDELRELSDRRFRLMRCPGSAMMLGETAEEIDAYWPDREDRELRLDLIIRFAIGAAQEALADEGDVGKWLDAGPWCRHCQAANCNKRIIS